MWNNNMGKDYDSNVNDISGPEERITKLGARRRGVTRRMRSSPTTKTTTGSCLGRRSIEHDSLADDSCSPLFECLLLFSAGGGGGGDSLQTVEGKMKKLIEIMHQADDHHQDGPGDTGQGRRRRGGGGGGVH